MKGVKLSNEGLVMLIRALMKQADNDMEAHRQKRCIESIMAFEKTYGDLLNALKTYALQTLNEDEQSGNSDPFQSPFINAGRFLAFANDEGIDTPTNVASLIREKDEAVRPEFFDDVEVLRCKYAHLSFSVSYPIWEDPQIPF